jgi:hypothetical protein
LDPALEEARRAGIDLDLLDSNLTLTYEQRWQNHDLALAKFRAYEKKIGVSFPVDTIIRRTRSGVELLLKVNDGHNMQLLTRHEINDAVRMLVNLPERGLGIFMHRMPAGGRLGGGFDSRDYPSHHPTGIEPRIAGDICPNRAEILMGPA